MTVAVVGVGAVGGMISAHLSAAGRDVVLCVRELFDELTVETPTGPLKVKPRMAIAPDAVGPVPWVVLATKAHQTAAAAPWLKALAGPETTIAILQNGVEHIARVAPYSNGATLLPAVVECRAARASPGRVIQRTRAEITVPRTDAGEQFAELLADTAVRVTRANDFVTVAWRKLCLNVASGAITALTDRPLGVVQRPEVAQVARDLIRECIAVGRAEGAQLEETLADQILASMVSEPPEAGTSMLADRRAGKPLEVDARNGAVVRFGVRRGIETPLNRAFTALLSTIHQEL